MNTVKQTTNAEITETEAEPEIEAHEPQAPPEPQAPAVPRKVLTIPVDTMGKIKANERERGRRAALADLNQRAQELGFSSHDEMLEAVAEARRAEAEADADAEALAAGDGYDNAEGVDAPPRQPTKPAPRGVPASRTNATHVQRLLDEKRTLRRSYAAEERRRKAAEEALAAQEVDHQLRLAAVKAGVQDVDYALEVLRRQVQHKSEAELAQFDEHAFFRLELRKSHPYLFEAPAPAPSPPEEEPANTSPRGRAPRPDAAERSAPANGSMDATKLSRAEYDKLLREKGLLNPATASTNAPY